MRLWAAAGVALVVMGIALLVFWALPAGTPTAWLVTAALLLGGGFAVFEAWAGWCVVRAMGVKTPL